MVDIQGLIGNLQARTAHAKVHTIHVNLTREWLALINLCHISAFVLEERHLDLDFLLPTALIYRLG